MQKRAGELRVVYEDCLSQTRLSRFLVNVAKHLLNIYEGKIESCLRAQFKEMKKKN
jgi:hypothetical protein